MIIFEHSMPSAVIWAGLAVAALAAAFSAWRYLRLDLTTIALLAVRLLFFGLLGWSLFQPQLKTALTHMLKPRFVIALDASRSMTLAPEPDISNRWSEAQAVLSRPWLAAVSAECEVDLYPVAAEVGPRLSVQEARDLAPDGATTLLRDSLGRLFERYKGQNVAGVLLLSDGIDTREVDNDWSAQDWPWPIYSVRLEPDAAWDIEPDLRVDAVQTPRRVTLGWGSELKAVVSGQGAKGQAVGVQLFGNDELLRETPTQVPAGGGAREVAFALDHDRLGTFTYRVFIPPLPGESHTNDNAYSVTVQVVDPRNRLLYVEGPPRWESKYLTRTLRTSDRVTPLCFIRGPNRKFMTIGERESTTTDMTPDQLAAFTIVILGNLDAEELGAERAANLARFVELGGSLVLLGGTKAWSDSGFAQTPLNALLPVSGFTRTPIEGKFPTVLTDAGRAHPAFAGEAELWSRVPPILSVFPDARLAPGAEALVDAQTPRGAAPIVVAQRYGQGKVVAIFTDSLWRWQLSPDSGDAKPYQRFWNQLLVWLSPPESELDVEQVELFADQEQLFLGERITLSARAAEALGDAEVRCLITTPDGREIPFAMARQNVVTPSGKTFPGFTLAYEAELPGLHAVVAAAESGGKRVASDPLSFFVKPFTPESVPKAANLSLLQELARRSGGACFDDAEALNDTLAALQFSGREEETVRYSSLWQTWVILSCLLSCLALEWSIRKWRNLP